MTFTPQATDLTDLASVEAFLNISGSDPDANRLQMLISAASYAAVDYIGHQIMYPVIADWAASTSYVNGSLILPTLNNPGGYTFRATQAGKSGSSEPVSWPQSLGAPQADGTTNWVNVGVGVNVTEQRSGTMQSRMMLKQFPVIGPLGSVEAYGVFYTLAVDDATDGAVMAVFGTRQRAEVDLRGIAAWPYGAPSVFPRGHLNVRFNYAFGYWTPGQAVTLNGGTPSSPASPPSGVPALPLHLKEAVTEAVALRYRQSKRWGDTSIGEGPQRVTFFMKEFHETTRMVLDRYSDKVPLL